MRYMASSQVLSGRCVPWSGVPEVTLNRYRQPRQLNRLGRVDSRRTSSLEHRGQRTPSGQRAASSKSRHSASKRNLSSRPGSVQSFIITIYRTPPAHQNPVRQGNNSVGLYRRWSASARLSVADHRIGCWRVVEPRRHPSGLPGLGFPLKAARKPRFFPRPAFRGQRPPFDGRHVAVSAGLAWIDPFSRTGGGLWASSLLGDYCLSAPRSGAGFVGNIDVTEAHQSLKYGLVRLGSAGLPSGPDLPCFGRGYRSRKWRTTSWRTPAFVTGASDPRHGERRRPMIRAAFTSAWICRSHQRQQKRSPSRFRAST